MKPLTEDEKWIGRCLQLARCGQLGAPPNPMVGAVLVADGRIIGEGYHRRCGQAHAEVNAFASVTRPDLLQRAKMYVSLEPCAHWGRTPPCARLIVEKGIRQVVVGCVDPFARVHGEGIRILREAGIQVTVGVREKECLQLNRRFVVNQTQGRPYIMLKWAESADGFIDRLRTDGTPVRFSTTRSSLRTHRLRAACQAIMVGRRTALLDNPRLNVRLADGPQPLRIVLDSQGTLPPSLHLFDGSQPTLVAGFHDNPLRRKSPAAYEVLALQPHDGILSQVLDHLHAHGIQSLLVEGGARLHQSFLEAHLWDEIHVEKSPVSLGSGLPAPRIPAQAHTEEETALGSHFIHAWMP